MDKITEFANKHRLSITTSTRGGFMTISIKGTKIPRGKTVKLSLDDTFEEMLDARLQEKEQQLEKKKGNDKKKKDKIKKEKKPSKNDRDYIMSLPIGKIDKMLRPIFSLAIRLAGAFEEDGGWYNYCYTTKEKCLISKLQAGHRISRSFRVRKYHIDNVKPQSYGANAKHIGNGMPLEFEGFLRAEGVDTNYMIENKNNKELLDIYYSKEYLVDLYFKCQEFIKATGYKK